MTCRLTITEIRELCSSARSDQRLRGLAAMRNQLLDGSPKCYLKIAEPLLLDRSDRCRWQASIVVGDFLGSDPEAVWGVVDRFVRHGKTRGCDALGVAVVEHLLAQDFSRYFSRLKVLWHDGHDTARELIEYCWAFGNAERHWHLVEEFLRDAGVSGRRRSP